MGPGLAWVDALLDATMILGGLDPVSELPTDEAKVFASISSLCTPGSGESASVKGARQTPSRSWTRCARSAGYRLVFGFPEFQMA